MKNCKNVGQRLKKGHRKFEGNEKKLDRKLGTLFRAHKFIVSLQL